MISTVAFDQNGSCDVVNWTFMEQLSGDQAALVTDRHWFTWVEMKEIFWTF